LPFELGTGLGHLGLGSLVFYCSAVAALLLSVFWQPRVGLYFLAPLLPLQTIRYRILDYPLGGQLVYIILLGVILGLLLRGESLVPPALPLKKILFIIMLVYFVSLWYGSFYLNITLPWSLDDPRVEGWINFMVMPVLYFVTVCAIKDVKQMKILLLLMCLGVFLVDWAFYKTMSGRDLSHFSDGLRYAGSLGWAGTNGLAAFEAQISLFLLGLYAFGRRRVVKWVILSLIFANMYCLLFSFSRGGYVAFLVGLIFLGLFKERKLLVLVLALLIGWQTLVPNAVRERIAMTVDESGKLESSSQTRITLWEDAYEMFRQNPLFGTGFETYRYMHRVGPYNDTHNMYMKVLVETGLIGLVLFLWLFLAVFRLGFGLFRSGQDPFLASVALGFTAMVVGAFVVNFFGDRWTYLQVNGSLWTVLACVVRGQFIVQQSHAGMFEEASIVDLPSPSTPDALPA